MTAMKPPAPRSSLLRGVRLATALCLGLAVTTTDERRRAPLLVTGLLAGTVWLALEGRDHRGRWSWPVAVLVTGMAGLLTVPAVLLVAFPGLSVDAGRPLSGGLTLIAITLAGTLAGLTLGRAVPRDRLPRLAARLARPPVAAAGGRGRVVAGWVVAALALGLFLHAAGGAREYFAHLDRTGASTAGLTYLIWGVLAAKFTTLAEVGRRWSAGRGCGRLLGVAAVASIGLAGLIGARILIVVALAQVALLALALRGPSRRTLVCGSLAAVAAFACIVGLGELRRWQSLAPAAGFSTYLTTSGLPELPRTYVNQYADGVRVAVLARAAVPDLAPFEHGTEVVRVLAQPIPGAVRPQLPRPAGLRAVFTTAGGSSGNALPLPVVGFLQAGAAGAAIAGLALGLMLAGIERAMAHARDPAVLLALIGAMTGAVMVLRGSLPQATALALMDVIGFLVAGRFAPVAAWRTRRRQRPRRTAPAVPAASTARNAA